MWTLLFALLFNHRSLMDAATVLATEHNPGLQPYIDTDIYRQATIVEAALKNGLTRLTQLFNKCDNLFKVTSPQHCRGVRITGLS